MLEPEETPEDSLSFWVEIVPSPLYDSLFTEGMLVEEGVVGSDGMLVEEGVVGSDGTLVEEGVLGVEEELEEPPSFWVETVPSPLNDSLFTGDMLIEEGVLGGEGTLVEEGAFGTEGMLVEEEVLVTELELSFFPLSLLCFGLELELEPELEDASLKDRRTVARKRTTMTEFENFTMAAIKNVSVSQCDQ